MKKLIGILKITVRALKAVIYVLSGGHFCKCGSKNGSAEKDAE